MNGTECYKHNLFINVCTLCLKDGYMTHLIGTSQGFIGNPSKSTCKDDCQIRTKGGTIDSWSINRSRRILKENVLFLVTLCTCTF